MSDDKSTESPYGLSPEDIRAIEIFSPDHFQRVRGVAERGGRFVHYTTAEAALSIAQSNCVWLRNALCMNDYREVQHGLECLRTAYDDHKDRFRDVLDRIFPELQKEVEGTFNSWLPQFLEHTYIFSFSEHLDHEDSTGRLSMWRAYGGNAGVAIVMKGEPFRQPSDALQAWTSPVTYLRSRDFAPLFTGVVDRIEASAEFVQGLGRVRVRNSILEAFKSAVLCTKHVGFAEEREWRVIYTPTHQSSERIIHEVRSIRGVPQSIYKIPLQDVPEEDLTGIEVDSLIDRIIIGPCSQPVVIWNAIVRCLTDVGVVNASSRVFISDVPLRL